MYRLLGVTGNPPDLYLDRLGLRRIQKETTFFEFYNGDRWVPLKKQKRAFFAANTLKNRLDGVDKMKTFLGIDSTPSMLERSISAASKLKSELLTDFQMESMLQKELSSLAEGIHGKTREASQNRDLNMREFFGIDKTLPSIQGELLKNTSKLTEINKCIKRDSKKVEKSKK